jgi:hypothetical protein
MRFNLFLFRILNIVKKFGKKKMKITQLVISGALIGLFSFVLLETAPLLSFAYPVVWTLQPNPFLPQKIYRQTRHVIQFLPNCAEYDERVTYRMKAGSCKFSNLEFDTNVNIYEKKRVDSSEIGVTEDNWKQSKCLIDFLGDSHTFGWGVEAKETFAYLTAKKLGCSYRNFGVSSYGTAREFLAYSRHQKPKVKKHFIVLQYSENDLDENIEFFKNSGNLKILPEAKYKSYQIQHRKNSKYYFGKHSIVFAKAVANELRVFIETSGNEINEKIVSEEKVFSYAFGKLQNISNDAQFIIMEINGTNQNDLQFITNVRKEFENDNELNKENVHTIDTSNILKKSDYFVLDDHMSISGHSKIAGSVTQLIRGLMRRK